ncbi:Methyltransferase domain-containing protein [Dyella jiangningensis]|uniref:class I SAM-dependent methyltransferase n=1 Tax=Dyella sp. AtDHG13 TaxID=1938897 RepID=UPI00088DD9F4|nr:class I SAM-dependent methyltransferase [Dyella sp. AtDHG13]PXV59136.1 methyltransferase family protein [Dyella sp. AtDHG13]SDK23470.1 Methyltransferase domain-containing protein [Dyella jiangningensis]
MTTPQQRFVADQYGPRAQDYVSSEVHRQGPDLDQIEAELHAMVPGRVLDLGCGGGHVTYRAAPLAREVVACDVTPDMLDAVRRTAVERGLDNVAVQAAPAERLPFDDDAFDVVVARYTTHHWHSRDAGLREARRVLKAGGRAIFIDVISPEHALLDSWLQTLELLRDVSHVRNYRASEWIAALAAAGFTVDGITRRRLPLRFPDWVARTRTPDAQVAAIRALQATAPDEVREHFAIADDGSFVLDTATFTAR